MSKQSAAAYTRTAATGRSRCEMIQVPDLFANVPADQRQDLDRKLRSQLARGRRPDRIWADLRLARRFGIRVGAVRRYARQLHAARSLPADGRAGQSAPVPPPARIADTQRLQDTLHHHLLDLLHQTLRNADLTPEQLCKLAAAFSRQRQAFTRAQAQSIVSSRYRRQLAAEREEARAKAARAAANARRYPPLTLAQVLRFFGPDRDADPPSATDAPSDESAHPP